MDIMTSLNIVKDWYLAIKQEGYKYMQPYIPGNNMDSFDLLVVYSVIIYGLVKFYS